jgi:hypothetical protein
MGADSFGREPHTARERVESLGADDKAQTEFGRGPEVRAWMVGADCRAHAQSTAITALAKQLQHSVITCTRFVSYNIQWIWKKKRNYDHLQQIWIFHCILKSFIYYGGKLCLHTWLVDTRFMQIPSKTTSKQ